MNKKVILTISVIIIYASLYVWYIKISAARRECSDVSLCLRFCSEDKATVSDKYLLDEFLKSKSGSNWGKSDYEDLKVFRGAPACGEMKFIPPNENITKRKHPYDFHYRGSIELDEEIYDFNRYCLKQADHVFDGWKLMICQQDVFYYRIFNLIAIFLSIFLFGFILFVYSYFKELRDFYGKFIIGFTTSQIMAYSIVPFITINRRTTDGFFNFIFPAVYFGSMIMTLLWITVMIVHSFVTFKNFKNQDQKSHDFSIYAIFVITLLLFTAFVFVMEQFSHTEGSLYLLLTYFSIGFFDIFFLILIGIKIFILSRKLTNSEQPIFDTERKWYWSTVKLSLIMLVTWPFVFVSWNYNRFALFNNLIADFVMILTSITVAVILLGRKQVKTLLFGKYRGISNVEN